MRGGDKPGKGGGRGRRGQRDPKDESPPESGVRPRTRPRSGSPAVNWVEGGGPFPFATLRQGATYLVEWAEYGVGRARGYAQGMGWYSLLAVAADGQLELIGERADKPIYLYPNEIVSMQGPAARRSRDPGSPSSSEPPPPPPSGVRLRRHGPAMEPGFALSRRAAERVWEEGIVDEAVAADARFVDWTEVRGILHAVWRIGPRLYAQIARGPLHPNHFKRDAGRRSTRSTRSKRSTRGRL